MTPPFLLELRAAQTNAAREYLARSLSWRNIPENDRHTALAWFGNDATDKLTAAWWDIHGFLWAFSAFRSHGGPLRRDAVENFNRMAEAVKNTAYAALSYAEFSLDLFATEEGRVMLGIPQADLDQLLVPVKEWFEKCKAACAGAFEHWEPLRVPSKEQIDAWSAAGDLIPVEKCLREAEARISPEERDELRRRVAAGG